MFLCNKVVYEAVLSLTRLFTRERKTTPARSAINLSSSNKRYSFFGQFEAAAVAVFVMDQHATIFEATRASVLVCQNVSIFSVAVLG